MLKKSNQNLHLAKNSELIFAHVLKIANLFVEKTFDLNKNYFDKIFINKYSTIYRKIDTLLFTVSKPSIKQSTIFNKSVSYFEF